MRRVLLFSKLCNHFTRDDGTLIACAVAGSISQARGTEMAAQLTTTSGCHYQTNKQNCQ